jgi:uncharacterized protein YrrD
MKKVQEIIGMPIISISDGTEVGRVKNVIINAAKGAIDFIVVDVGGQSPSAKVIPSENILGIGGYALTIENEEAINEINKLPAAIDLLQKNIQITGNKVLTKKGRLIGEVGDIYVDGDANCTIQGVEFIGDITKKNNRIIPRSSVITFGKNLVIVIEEVENTLLDGPEGIKDGNATIEIEKKDLMGNGQVNNKELTENIVIETDKLMPAEGDSLFEEVDNEVDTSYQKQNSEYSVVMDPISTHMDTGSLFEQRQKQYLNGRIATKTITADSGEVVIREGSVITDSIIDFAKGSGKLIELIMNNKA